MTKALSFRHGVAFRDWYKVEIPIELVRRDNWEFMESLINMIREITPTNSITGIPDFQACPDVEVDSPITTWIKENCQGKFVRHGAFLWFEDQADAVIFNFGLVNNFK